MVTFNGLSSPKGLSGIHFCFDNRYFGVIRRSEYVTIIHSKHYMYTVNFAFLGSVHNLQKACQNHPRNFTTEI